MKNQLNQIIGCNNQKQERLKELYKQLDTMTHLNLRDNLSKIKANSAVAESKLGEEESQNPYNDTIQSCLMNADTCAKQFDYSDLNSILERKKNIEEKLMLIKQKQEEEDNMHHTYNQMISQLQKKNMADMRENQLLEAKEANL